MDRRRFLAAIGTVAALNRVPALAANTGATIRTTSHIPPRKVIVGTVMHSFWGEYPGLRKRLEQLTGIVDQMSGEAKKAYRRGLDLAILPETAITGEAGDDALARAVAFEGEVRETFTQKAREHSCYIVVPTYLLDSK